MSDKSNLEMAESIWGVVGIGGSATATAIGNTTEMEFAESVSAIESHVAGMKGELLETSLMMMSESIASGASNAWQKVKAFLIKVYKWVKVGFTKVTDMIKKLLGTDTIKSLENTNKAVKAMLKKMKMNTKNADKKKTMKIVKYDALKSLITAPANKLSALNTGNVKVKEILGNIKLMEARKTFPDIISALNIVSSDSDFTKESSDIAEGIKEQYKEILDKMITDVEAKELTVGTLYTELRASFQSLVDSEAFAKGADKSPLSTLNKIIVELGKVNTSTDKVIAAIEKADLANSDKNLTDRSNNDEPDTNYAALMTALTKYQTTMGKIMSKTTVETREVTSLLQKAQMQVNKDLTVANQYFC